MGTKVLLLFVFCLLFNTYKAQQPAYFIFGEEQFKGVQIYDVIQDKDLNYWFATNEGLYYFDYYYYNKIECDEAKGSSVFNFTINREGTIYCHNLNNQIFEIKNKNCSLFYELKVDESSSDISLTVADDDNLVIGAKQVVVLNKNGKKVLKYPASKHYLGSAFSTKNHGIQFHLSGIDSVLIYEKGVFKKEKLHFLSGSLKNESVLKFFSNYAIDLRTKDLYSFNPSTFELNQLPKNAIFERSQSERIYETEGIIWVTGTLPGTALIDKKITIENYPIYYGDYFISDIYKDKEGNILLSTFDKGVLVIPDTKVPDVIHTFKEDPANALYSDSLFGLMIGTSKGTLMNYLNNKLTTINAEGKRPIEAIYGNNTSNLIVFDNGGIRAYNKKTSTITNIIHASLKDAVILSDNLIYLGTNRGVMKVVSDGNNTFNTQLLKGVDFRIYSIEYNPDDRCLYASTANGLFTIFPDGNIKPLLINKKVIYPNYLHFYNGHIYASTKANGILIIQHGKIVNVIHPIINNQEEILKKISIHQNTVIAKSSNGLFQFNMNGKLLKALHSVFGFSSKRIIDFTFHQNQLWVSHSGGVQPINLNYNKTALQKPFIRLNHILVNDELINPFQTSALNSDQRKLQFIFSSTTLRNHESMHYYYKLDGYDLNWNINNYESNQITYSALAPGNYTFYLKVEIQGVFSEPVSYSFTIASPFYVRWWFIVISIIIFLGIVLMVYRWQLNIQRKKSQQINELNASKLTAIQSQMNPHFIFNSLNAIQNYIFKQDSLKAGDYLAQFSELIRMILDYSRKDYISVEAEVKLLNTYLELQKLRFESKFDYTITIDKKIDRESISIPPMLAQPFIENAIEHGIFYKKDKGRVDVRLFYENNFLIYEIEDDGVGMEEAMKLKNKLKSSYDSLATIITKERMTSLNEQTKGNVEIEILDKKTVSAENSGVKVKFIVPYKAK